MWRHLRLTSLGVIQEAELELSDGFTAVTGETGAGKTMIVTALSLLRGERADSSLIRHGASQARIEAEIDAGAEIEAIVTEVSGDIEDGVVLISRVLSDQGRSRAYVGGASVPAQVLANISDYSVAVHGQADQYRLLRPSAQREAVDSFAGEAFGAELSAYREGFERFLQLRTRLDNLVRSLAERASEAQRLRLALTEIDDVAPVSGELESLNHESARLTHADALLTAAHRAHDLVLAEDSAADSLAKAAAELEAAAINDESLNDIAKRVRELAIGAGDIGQDLTSYLASLEADPVRLAQVEERRAALNRILRSYGTDIDAVLAWAADARQRLEDLELSDEHIEQWRAELAEMGNELLNRARSISTLRQSAAEDLSRAIEAELAQLAMEHAQIVISVAAPEQPSTDDLGAWGFDQVEILFTANTGGQLRPLNKAASGGELSRVMLALEVVLVDTTAVPTLVFDEVDAGIGGKAAVEVGRRLAQLAKKSQVIAVTHLPQVAAFADHHFHVEKTSDGSVTVSSVKQLVGEDRVNELARMLAGVDTSSAAQNHARELLDMAGTARS